MADKLSKSTWTAFLKKQKHEIDDAALVKALAAYDATDESKPEPRLGALKAVDAEIGKQVLALAKRKKELGDKPWKEAKDQLDAMLAESERLTREARAAMAAAAGAASAGAAALAALAAELDAVEKQLAGIAKIAEDKRLKALQDFEAAIATHMLALSKRM
jgi:hypothetical protein